MAKLKSSMTGTNASLKELLDLRDSRFFDVLRDETRLATQFSRALSLNTMRKRASAQGLESQAVRAVRLAIVGGSSLRPLADLIEHFVTVLGMVTVELWI